MQATQFALGFLPVLPTLATSSQFFVQAAQLFQQMAQRSLVFVPPPIGERGEPIESNIDADGWVVIFQYHVGHFHRDGDKPPVCCLGDAG